MSHSPPSSSYARSQDVVRVQLELVPCGPCKPKPKMNISIDRTGTPLLQASNRTHMAILNTSNEAAASTDGYNYFVDYIRYGGIELDSLLHCRNLQVQNTVNRPYLWRKIEIFFLSPTAQVKAMEGTNSGRKTWASQISAECVSGLSSHCSKVSTIH